MVPFLSKGSAELEKAATLADRYGLVMSEVDVKMSAEFNDTIQESIFALRGLRNILGLGLIKVIKPLAEKFNQFISENRVRLADKIRFTFDGMATFVRLVWHGMLALVESAGRFIDLFGGIEKIAQILGVVAAVFVGGKLLSGIGSVVVAVWRAVAAFTAMNIAALAIPLAIGAIAVGIGLLIEDIITFFNGGDSYFGKFLANFPTLGKAILGVFSLVKKSVMDVVDTFKILFSWVKNIAAAVLEFIAPVLAAIGKGIGWIGEKIGMKLGQFDTTGAYEILQKNNFTAQSIQSGQDVLGKNASPLASPTTSTSTAISNIKSPLKVDSQMTFNVGSDVDPTSVAPKLQTSIEDGFSALLRKVGSSYQGEGAPVY